MILCGDLPGVEPADLDIRFENRELTVLGKVAPRHADRRSVYGEYGVGDFYRTFAVGESIDADKIAAELKNGVLTLHLPKTDAVKPGGSPSRRASISGRKMRTRCTHLQKPGFSEKAGLRCRTECIPFYYGSTRSGRVHAWTRVRAAAAILAASTFMYWIISGAPGPARRGTPGV